MCRHPIFLRETIVNFLEAPNKSLERLLSIMYMELNWREARWSGAFHQRHGWFHCWFRP